MNKNQKIIATLLGITGAYFVYKYFAQKKPVKTANQPIDTTPAKPEPPTTDSFPLKKGSKGNTVKSVQEIILKIDKSLLPKFGADGDFGSETESAVFKLLGKKTIDAKRDINTLNSILNKKLFPYVTKKEEPKPTLPTFGIKLF